jgi:hypothetical protein
MAETTDARRKMEALRSMKASVWHEIAGTGRGFSNPFHFVQARLEVNAGSAVVLS